MSFSIGVLTIEMAANVARLQSDMSQAKQVVSDSVKSMQATVDMLKGAFIGLTGVASFAAFKGMIDGALEGAAQLHKLSIQSGIAVESLSGLAVVGKATGTSAETIAAASNKLSKALASSNEDSKGAAAALKALGLSFNDFQQMAPDERFKKIADAMDGFKDGGQKSAAAMMLMGKTGAEMLPFMKDLANTGELTAKITTEQAEAAHQYEAALGKLKTQSEAWKKSLAMELLPTLNSIVDVMLEMKSSTADTGKLLGEGFTVVLQTVAVMGVNLVYVFKQIGNEVGGLAAQLMAVAHLDFKGAGVIGDAMKSDAVKARVEVDRLSASLLSLNDKKVKAPEEPKKALTGLAGDPQGGAENQGLALLNTLKSKYEQLTGGVSEYYDALRKMAAMKQAIDPIVRREIEAQARLNDQFVAQKANIDSFTKAEEARQAAIELADQAFTDATRNMSQATKDYDFQISLVGKNAEQVTRLTAVRAIDLQQMKIEAELGNARGAGLISQEQFLARLNVTQREANALKEKQAELMKVEDQRRTDPSAGIDQATKDYVEKVRKMGDAWKSATASQMDGLENNLVDMLTKGKASWKDYFNSILADSVRLNIIRPMLAQLIGPGAGTGATAGAGGGGMNWGGIVSGAAKLFGFAEGGNPPVGVPYMVGEKGPELRIDRTPGTIIPNDKLGAMGGGKAISLTNNITVAGGVSAAEAYTAIQKALAENNRQWTESLRRQGVIA
jgi:lambda family phage tail tape measure protein